MIFRQALLGSLFIALLSSATLAQEKSALEKRLEDWSSVKTQIFETKTKFEAATEADQQTELRNQYTGLLDEANLIVDDLRDMSLSAFKTDNKNRLAIKTMMGIAIQDVNRGEDQQVLELGDTLIAAGLHPLYFETAVGSDRLEIEGKEVFEEILIRQKEAASDNLPRVALKTAKGEIVLELFENEAPDTVGNFISLAKKGFYDGLKFHRVIDGFMAQAGDPKNNGSGGPGYKIYCECADSPEYRRHFTGSLSMAKLEDVNTGGSQFFLTMQRTNKLDGKHTVFGRIVSGMDVLQTITRTATTNPVTGVDDPIAGAVADAIQSVAVLRDRGHEYEPNKVPEEESDGE
jgi:cyclophilin family peptidyl-prolyl cis-trans isomerase